MRLTKLTSLILYLNMLIDRGKQVGISIEEAKSHIRSGDVFSWLRDRFPDEMKNHYSEPKEDAEVLERLQSIQDAYGGDERKRWGVENSGICLLLAWTNELIADGEWTNDSSPP